LAASEDASLREWARSASARQGIVSAADYHNLGIGGVLRAWADATEADGCELAWVGLGHAASLMDLGALEALAGHCPALPSRAADLVAQDRANAGAAQVTSPLSILWLVLPRL